MVVHPSTFGPQGIQAKDCPSIVCPKQMKAIMKAYDILDDILIRVPEGDERADLVVDGWIPMYTLL